MNIDKVFEFIKEKRGYNAPAKYKLLNGLPLTGSELTVDGYLDLSDINISTLPDNLTVNGDMDIRNTNITELPNNLYVDGSLIMNRLYISSIPDNLHVEGNLYIRHTPLEERYSDSEIAKMIIDKGGFLYGDIFSARR